MHSEVLGYLHTIMLFVVHPSCYKLLHSCMAVKWRTEIDKIELSFHTCMLYVSFCLFGYSSYVYFILYYIIFCSSSL